MEFIQIFSDTKCVFCFRESDEFNFGKFYEFKDFSVHFLCLITATNVTRQGAGRRIENFLEKDILQACSDNSNKFCEICNSAGASIKCHTCSSRYHLDCGLKNGAVVEMCENFISYCKDCAALKYQIEFSDKEFPFGTPCFICYLPVEDDDKFFWPPCCKPPNELVHFYCLKMYAFQSGPRMKCPLCANEDNFRKAVRKSSIYIPNESRSLFDDVRTTCYAATCKVSERHPCLAVVSCLLCSKYPHHIICTFGGIVLCDSCLVKLWPIDQVMNVSYRNMYFIQNDNAHQLLKEVLKIDFSWFMGLLKGVHYDVQITTIIRRILTKVGHDLRFNNKVHWHEVLDKEDQDYIVAKIKGYVAQKEALLRDLESE